MMHGAAPRPVGMAWERGTLHAPHADGAPGARSRAARRRGPVWVSSGLHLAAPTADGRVEPTPDLIRAFLMRAELRPVPESGPMERALHESLVDDPARAVAADEVAAVEDADTAENFRLFLRFRDHLLGHGTVEAAYLALQGLGADGRSLDAGAMLKAPPLLPPLLVDQLVHLIVANLFERTLSGASALHARAAELLFREQVVSMEGGSLVFADAETVDAHEGAEGAALFRMVEEAGTARRGVELDVLGGEEAGEVYWPRADRFDTALDMRVGQPAPEALADVLEAWTAHLLDVELRIQPVADISDSAWRWHVGLDANASVLLDRLYAGEALEEEDARRIAGLFRLDFEDQSRMREDVRGRPVHLALAMSSERRVRMKPQNLLVNLPFAE